MPQVISVAQTFSEVWEGVSSLLAEMDVLLGFAELAVNAPMPYVRPEMLPSSAGEVVLEGSR
jgi:DNA mismatch repair protein MSH2